MNPDLEVKQKRLTKFLCQELLYEYVHGLLNPQREKEMREYIEGCRESKAELERLKRGLAYAQKARAVKVSPALREALLSFEPHWQKQLRDWTLWSSQRGWKMLPYAVLFLTLSTGLIVWKPWQKVDAPEVVLAEQLRQEPDMLAPPTGDQPTPMPQPETALAPPVVAAVPQPAPVTPAPDIAVTAPGPTGMMKAPAASDTSDKAKTEIAAAAVAGMDKAKTKSAVREDSSDDKAVAPSPSRGFIMRGELDVSDFGNTWPLIRDKIVAMGGKVAGNVELGWLRRPDQSYFHFTISETNYPELELFLGTFGPVRFSKERHPRVMPEGQIRIILTVKDAIINEAPPETP